MIRQELKGERPLSPEPLREKRDQQEIQKIAQWLEKGELETLRLYLESKISREQKIRGYIEGEVVTAMSQMEGVSSAQTVDTVNIKPAYTSVEIMINRRKAIVLNLIEKGNWRQAYDYVMEAYDDIINEVTDNLIEKEKWEELVTFLDQFEATPVTERDISTSSVPEFNTRDYIIDEIRFAINRKDYQGAKKLIMRVRKVVRTTPPPKVSMQNPDDKFTKIELSPIDKIDVATGKSYKNLFEILQVYEVLHGQYPEHEQLIRERLAYQVKRIFEQKMATITTHSSEVVKLIIIDMVRGLEKLGFHLYKSSRIPDKLFLLSREEGEGKLEYSKIDAQELSMEDIIVDDENLVESAKSASVF